MLIFFAYCQTLSFASLSEEIFDIGIIKAVNLNADELIYDERAETLKASGNAVLIATGLVLSADELEYSLSFDVLIATGDVTINYNSHELKADTIKLNLKTNEILLANASIIKLDTSPDNRFTKGFTLKGAKISRDNHGLWKLTKAKYTACDCGNDKPSWSIACGEARINHEQNLKLTKPVFYIKNIPVFALPTLTVPLSKRKSGFLLPRVSYSNSLGFRLRGDIFWASQKDRDMTFTLDGMTKKGFKPELEFRQISTKSATKLNTFYLYDLEGNQTKVSTSRFAITANQYKQINSWLRESATIKLLSDSYIQNDFGLWWRDRNHDFTESNINLTAKFPEVYLIASFEYYQQLFDPHEVDGWLWSKQAANNIQIIPKLKFSLPAKVALGGKLLISFDAELALLYQPSKAFIDIYAPGHFKNWPEDNEARTRAVKVLVSPKITMPFKLSRFALLKLSAEFNHKTYRILTTNDDAIHEGYFDLMADISSKIYRIFETKNGSRLKHQIKPEIIYSLIPHKYSSTHLDENALSLLAPLDKRITPHYVQFSLKQTLSTKSKQKNISHFLGFDISQRLFIDHETRNKYSSFFDDTMFYLWLNHDRIYWQNRLDINWKDMQISSASSRLRLDAFLGTSLGIKYFFLRQGAASGYWLYQAKLLDNKNIHQLGIAPAWTFKNIFSATFALDFDLNGKKLIETGLQFDYNSPCNCWGASLSIIHRPGQNAPDIYFSVDISGVANNIRHFSNSE